MVSIALSFFISYMKLMKITGIVIYRDKFYIKLNCNYEIFTIFFKKNHENLIELYEIGKNITIEGLIVDSPHFILFKQGSIIS